MKACLITVLILAALLPAAVPRAASAANCACWDPSTSTTVGPLFPLPTGGDCNAVCSAPCRLSKPDLRCFLCAPEGGIDCSSLTGGSGGGTSIEIVFANIKFALNQIIVWLFLLATALLLIGILQYITAGGEEERIKKARALIMYGILGLAVMVTVWAFVTVVIDLFFQSGTEISIPGGEVVRPL